MRILDSIELTEGHEAPNTEHITTDIARLNTANLLVPINADDPQDLPDEITIRVRPVGVTMADQSSQVSLVVQGTGLLPQQLYNENTLSHQFPHPVTRCQFAAIQLIYESSPWTDALGLTPGDSVYEKPFAVQVGNHISETRTEPMTTPHPLYGYGGLYSEGLALRDMQPIYFQLFEGLQRTEIVLGTAEQWRDRAVTLDESINHEQSLSLGAALAEGYARLRVDEEGLEYTSIAGEPNAGHPELIDLTFRKIKP